MNNVHDVPVGLQKVGLYKDFVYLEVGVKKVVFLIGRQYSFECIMASCMEHIT